MMNKTEFEARVRQLALAKTEKIKKRNRIIKTVSTIAGGVAAAACIVLVMTRMNGILMESVSMGNMSSGTINNMNSESMLPDKDVSDDKCWLEDEMTQTDELSPGDGMDGEADKNDVESSDKNGADSEEIPSEGVADMVITLFSEVNSTPETVVLSMYPGSDDEKLSQDGIDLVMDWIRNLDLTDMGIKENNEQGLLYKFELTYPQVTRTVYVFDEMIKTDDGTWYEFTRNNAVEFKQLIEDIRE